LLSVRRGRGKKTGLKKKGGMISLYSSKKKHGAVFIFVDRGRKRRSGKRKKASIPSCERKKKGAPPLYHDWSREEGRKLVK